VPTLSVFYGIIITMYRPDHAPPHFHVRYAEHRAQVRIDPLVVIEGRLPPRVLGLVFEWAATHQQELNENWHLAQQRLPLQKIPPLQ
jgi:hypothetical protein